MRTAIATLLLSLGIVLTASVGRTEVPAEVAHHVLNDKNAIILNH